MKFEYIGPNSIENVDGKLIERPAKSYGGENVLNGETVELEGFFAEKAEKNPNYRRIKPGPKPKETRETMFGVSAKDRPETAKRPLEEK